MELHKDLGSDTKARGPSAWKQFRAFSPIKEGAHGKAFVDTRWARTWEVVDGKKTATPRMSTNSHQSPDLEGAT